MMVYDLDLDKFVEPKYMVECKIYDGSDGLDSEYPEAWKDEMVYFSSEKEMVDFIKEQMSYWFRCVAAYSIQRIDLRDKIKELQKLIY